MIEIELPRSRFAYGRVLRDAAVAFYSTTTIERGRPPIGSRDYSFIVGVYDDVVAACQVVGRDESTSPDEDWPPRFGVTDPITGEKRVYHRGQIRAAEPGEDIDRLEPAAVWDLEHIRDRLSEPCR